jgi:hypothetical protein
VRKPQLDLTHNPADRTVSDRLTLQRDRDSNEEWIAVNWAQSSSGVNEGEKLRLSERYR